MWRGESKLTGERAGMWGESEAGSVVWGETEVKGCWDGENVRGREGHGVR